jgi:hypothetical protein
MSALAAGCSAALLGLANACGGTDTTTGTTSGAQTDGGSTGGSASGSGAATGSGASASTGGAINGSGSSSSSTGGRSSGAGGRAEGGRGGAGSPGGSGNGGSSECPPECFVNNRCVEMCGQPPQDFGCCPCPSGMINVFSCGAGGASGGTGGASGGGTSCDPRKALCRALPPNCPTGQVPSVDGSCWGDCVPIATCTCTAAEDCPDPNQYTCHMSRGVCDYYVN